MTGGGGVLDFSREETPDKACLIVCFYYIFFNINLGHGISHRFKRSSV